jgi:hypothetical protein
MDDIYELILLDPKENIDSTIPASVLIGFDRCSFNSTILDRIMEEVSEKGQALAYVHEHEVCKQLGGLLDRAHVPYRIVPLAFTSAGTA